MTAPKRRKPGEHRSPKSHYAKRPQNKKRSQLERIGHEPHLQAKISKLIDEGVAPQQAAKQLGIGPRAFRAWWRTDVPEAVEFRRRHADALRKGGRRGPRPELVVNQVAAAMRCGLDQWAAFSVQGISRRKASSFLAANPDVRERLAQASTGLEQQILSNIAAASSTDWRAGLALLRTRWPEKYETALVRKQLEDDRDQVDIASAIMAAFAGHAIAHAGSTNFAEARIASLESELLESDGDGEVEDDPKFQELLQTAHVAQSTLSRVRGQSDTVAEQQIARSREEGPVFPFHADKNAYDDTYQIAVNVDPEALDDDDESWLGRESGEGHAERAPLVVDDEADTDAELGIDEGDEDDDGGADIVLA